MIVLEWIGAHFLAPFINLYRAIAARPRPDPRILDLEPTGGGTHVDFRASVANYGTQQCRCEVTALVGSERVECNPTTLDLPANSPPQAVRVLVPRPGLGDLVPQFNSDTTLYGKTLRVEATAGKHTSSKEWREHVYTREENYQRHDIQQRVWRFGHGQETESDVRQEHLEEAIKRREEKFQRGPDYDWNP